MEHHTVRKVLSVPLADDLVWNDSWSRSIKETAAVISAHISAKVNQSSGRLTSLSGFASTLGGLLWIALLLLLQLRELPYNDFPMPRMPDIVYLANAEMLLAPMLLFVIALFGLFLYTQRAADFPRFGKIGLRLSFLGLGTEVIITILDYGLGLSNPTGIVDFTLQLPTSSWYGLVQSGLVVLSAGLVLFGVAALRTKLLPTSGSVLLIVSSIAIHLPFLVLIPALAASDAYALSVLPRLALVLTALLILFGAAWIWLGYILWFRSLVTHAREVEIE